MSTSKKIKIYRAKVPVYTSELMEDSHENSGGKTFTEMVQFITNKITLYNGQDIKVSIDKRNKTPLKQIESIEIILCAISDRPCILMKISAFNTNLFDGFVDIDGKKNLKQNSKFGSDNNFVLVVPNIIGVDSSNFKFQWIFLVYEDPSKENSDIVLTAKLVINKVLGITVANIKVPELLDELEKVGVIPEMTMNFSSVTYEENDVDVKLKSYLVSGKLRKLKEDNFENVPIANVTAIIDDKGFFKSFHRRVMTFKFGKTEFKLTTLMRDSIKDAQGIIEETAEELFNAQIEITESEMKGKFYDVDFILSKLEPVVKNYLS